MASSKLSYSHWFRAASYRLGEISAAASYRLGVGISARDCLKFPTFAKLVVCRLGVWQVHA